MFTLLATAHSILESVSDRHTPLCILPEPASHTPQKGEGFENPESSVKETVLQGNYNYGGEVARGLGGKKTLGHLSWHSLRVTQPQPWQTQALQGIEASWASELQTTPFGVNSQGPAQGSPHPFHCLPSCHPY